MTDLEARTSLDRLFAVGEVACTGVHGANRLASNSLLEALVFADHAAARTEELLEGTTPVSEPAASAAEDSGAGNEPGRRAAEVSPEFVQHMKLLVQTLMWTHVGIVRSNHRLSQALRELRILESAVETLYQSSRVSEGTGGATEPGNGRQADRRVSLDPTGEPGSPLQCDYPERDDHRWLRDTIIRRADRAGSE